MIKNITLTLVVTSLFVGCSQETTEQHLARITKIAQQQSDKINADKKRLEDRNQLALTNQKILAERKAKWGTTDSPEETERKARKLCGLEGLDHETYDTMSKWVSEHRGCSGVTKEYLIARGCKDNAATEQYAKDLDEDYFRKNIFGVRLPSNSERSTSSDSGGSYIVYIEQDRTGKTTYNGRSHWSPIRGAY